MATELGKVLDAPLQEEGMVQVDSEDVSDLEMWTAEKVADYFAAKGKGYDNYRDVFLNNHLSGDRIVNITQEDVPDLGIAIIGDRVGLLKEVKHLQSRARLQNARKIIQQEEEAFNGCWIQEKIFTCCGICPRDPDQYILKTGKLQIKHFELVRLCGIVKCICLGGEWQNDNIALDRIVDVDTVTETRGICCCKVHKAQILIAVAAGTGADSEEARVTWKPLFVEGDIVGDDRTDADNEADPGWISFADRLLNAAEDYVARLRGTL